MRILYIDTPLEPSGGGQISLFSILKNLNKTKFEPMVFVPYECKFVDWLKKENIIYKIVKPIKLYLEIKEYNPDVIHCNSPTTKYAFYSVVVSNLLKIPFLWHNRVLETAGWKEKLIAKISTKIIVISDAVEKKFSTIKDKVVKIYNAVDTEKFKPGLDIGYLYKEFNINRNSKIVGIIARLDPQKGHNFFLETAKIVKDKIGNQIIFFIAGTGEEKYKKELIKFTKELNLTENVIFTGFREDMPEIINLCDVIVNPSIEPESFGRTIIETMACGKVVIATKAGGPLEIITGGIDGFLVKLDANELSGVLLRILNEEKLTSEIGKNAIKKVKEKFDIKTQIEKIEQLYMELISKYE